MTLYASTAHDRSASPGRPLEPELRLADVEASFARAWLVWLGIAAWLVAIIASWVAPQALDSWGSAVTFAAAIAGISLLGAAQKWPVRRRGTLVARGRTVSLEGAASPWLGSRTVCRAVSTCVEGQTLVHLSSGRFSRMTARVADPADARRLLATLGQSANQTTTRFPCRYGEPLALLPIVAVGAAAALVAKLEAAAHVYLALPILMPLITVLIPRLRWSSVTVGEDGISVRRVFRSTFFVPFARIEEVRRDDDAVLVRVAGREEPLRFRYANALSLDMFSTSAPGDLALYERLREAREEARERRPHPARTLLARGGSTGAAWRDRVDGVAGAAASYRATYVPTEELWDVVSDPHEPAEVRAGAAVALRQHLDADGCERLRVAAETVADLPLRRIFTAVRAHDEQAMAEALDDLAPTSLAQPQMSVSSDVST